MLITLASQDACLLHFALSFDEATERTSSWSNADTADSLADQIQCLQLQVDHIEARYHTDQVQAQRSTTAAADI